METFWFCRDDRRVVIARGSGLRLGFGGGFCCLFFVIHFRNRLRLLVCDVLLNFVIGCCHLLVVLF